MKYWKMLGLAVVICHSSLGLAKETTTLAEQRALFLQVEKAIAKGNFTPYQNSKKKLKNYPLYPYLEFADLEKRIASVSLDEFQTFLKNYHDSPLAEQLRSRWLQDRAYNEDWKGYLQGYKPTEDTALQCNAMWAELKINGQQKSILDNIQALWLKSKTTPKSCEAVFNVYEHSGLMTRPLLWQRIKLAVQEGNEKLARFLAKYLNKTEFALVELWIMVHNNPYLITQPKYFSSKHPAYLEMIVHGASEIAKTKPETAIQIWQQINKRYPFTERHWGLVVRSIGLAFAKSRHPDAEKWLSRVPNIYTNQAVHEWRIRVALTKEDWHTVLHWMKTFPQELANTEEWKYWQARALDNVGRTQECQTLLTQLSKARSYYGFLASQMLLKPYFIVDQKIAFTDAQVQAISKRPGIQRAHEFHVLKRAAKAKSEWRATTNKMNDQERHAAAKLALQWNLPNWSILALSNANNKNDLELRFPMMHSTSILSEAKRHQIDPAWIFAVTRQESAFVSDAKSSAGALGLMQLIPSTAKMVSKRKQIPLKGNQGLLEPQTNIRLGSGYLRMMLDSHKENPVLATAAYNAGPGRIRQWMPSFDMSADTWIETIPFKETREYVKNVLTYTVIYQQLLGKKPTLANHMPYIPGNK